jgi:hypothetical protein
MLRQPSLHVCGRSRMGPSYRLLRTRLVSRYADCLAWLERDGLTIGGDMTDAISYSPPEPGQTPMDSDPAQSPSPQVREHN